MRQAANSNGEDQGAGCDLGTPQSAKRRFIAAVMTVHAAEEMMESGDVVGGMAGYRKAIEICPDCDQRGDFRVILGSLHFDRGEVAAAASEFQAALSGSCSYPNEAYRRLSFALAAGGEYAAALTAIDEAEAAGEDPAFTTQYRLILMLASKGLTAALTLAEVPFDLTSAQAEYRCRLGLLRAELHRLDGNRAAALASLDLAAAMAEEDGLGAELALWLAVLDRHFGREEPRPDVGAAFAAEPKDWASIAWRHLTGDATAAWSLAEAFAPLSVTRRAENQAIIHRLQGLLHEAAGDPAAAYAAYARAQTDPHIRWCADWHIAALDMERVKGRFA